MNARPSLVYATLLFALGGCSDAAAQSVSPGPRPSIVAVHAAHQATTPDGCRITARADGTMRVRRVPGATIDQSTLFDPRLTIDVEVRCPFEPRPVAAHFVTPRVSYARDELERLLTQRTTVHVREDVRDCTLAPAFVVEASSLRIVDVAETCQIARGGGPPTAGSPMGDQNRLPDGSPRPRGVYDREPGYPGPLGLGDGAPSSAPRTPTARGGGPRDVVEHTDTQQHRRDLRPRGSEQHRDTIDGTGADIDQDFGPYGNGAAGLPGRN